MAACGGGKTKGGGRGPKTKRQPKEEEKDDKEEVTGGVAGRVAASSEKGAKQYQEDAWVIFCSHNKAFSCIGVFDGSGGKNGQLASQKCRELALEWCKQNWETLSDLDEDGWKKELNQLFKSMHEGIRAVFSAEETKRRAKSKKDSGGLKSSVLDAKKIVRLESGKPVSGGTTAALCITVNKGETRRVVCANVGDSYAVLVPLEDRKASKDDIKFEFLSVNDSPLNKDEYLRVQGLPNEQKDKLIFVYDLNDQEKKYLLPKIYLSFGKDAGKQDPKYVKDPWGNNLRPTNVRYDPAVYAITSRAAEEEVCLAVTRGLGYFHAQPFGLTWEPHVRIQTLDPRRKYLVAVASDGIWDAWKFEDFTKYATKTVTTYPNDLLRAVKMIVDASVARTKALFGAQSFDDASLCLTVVPKASAGKSPKKATTKS